MNRHDTASHLDRALYSAGALPELERARYGRTSRTAARPARRSSPRCARDRCARNGRGRCRSAPSAALPRARVLARAAARTEAPRAPAARPAPAPLAAALFAAAAAGIALAAVFGTRRCSRCAASWRARADHGRKPRAPEAGSRRSSRCASSSTRRARRARSSAGRVARGHDARVLTTPSTRAVALAGQGPVPKARARLPLARHAHAGDPLCVRSARARPTRPEAWVTGKKTPIAAGVFDWARAASRATGRERQRPDRSPVAVTIEPRGGLPAPSG